MKGGDDPGSWLRAKIHALLRGEWRGEAGQLLRRTGEAIEKFNEEHVHIEEKIQAAPEVGWNTLRVKSSQTELNIAETEEKKIASVLALRTLEAKARQEDAAASLAETNAQIAKTQLLQAWLNLAKDLREAGTMLRLDNDGNFTIHPAPPDFNFNSLTKLVAESVFGSSVEGISSADQPPKRLGPEADTLDDERPESPSDD
jgi:hypothetical protein